MVFSQKQKILLLFFYHLVICFLLTLAVKAEVSLESRVVSYDAGGAILCAEGDVVVKQFGEKGKVRRELQTQSIEYNRRTGSIVFKGKTTLTESTGEVIVSEEIKIDDDFKKGIIKALTIVMKDKAWIDAESGEKNEDEYTLIKAKYSPCYKNKEKCTVPLWDLYADKVIYDSKNKTLTYHNVRLRMKGHAILYTPYFSHPSFEVKRKSGFVTPIIHANNDTGTLVGIPYFWVLSNNKNLKITPFINFRRRGFLVVEYQEALPNANLKISTSVLSKSHNKKEIKEELKTRWHVDVSYKTINFPDRRFIFKVNRSSDVTYPIKYPVSRKYSDSIIQSKCTTTKIGGEFFGDNYFADIKTYLFQTPNKEVSPFVFPKLDFNYEQDDVLKGTAFYEGNALFLTRQERKFSKDLSRFINKLGWKKETPYSNGVVIDFYTSIRLDSYFANTFNNFDRKVYHGNIYPISENSLALSYPMYSKLFSECTSIWGPKVSLSSLRCSSSRVNLNVNEDSVFSFLDDLNLFENNKGNGLDKLDKGEKVTYGLENSIYTGSGSRLVDMFIGRSGNLNYRKEKSYGVCRLVFHPFDVFSIRTRFVGIPFIEKGQMHEVGANLTIKSFNFDCAYFGENRTNQFREYGLSQLGCSVGYKINKYWALSCSQVFNFKRKAGNRNIVRGIFCKYKDECFEFGFGVYKSNYKDRDLKRKTGIAISFAFKNLCEMSHHSRKYDYNSIINNIE